MNALDVYRRCVIDLDKYDTPTFEIEDFNRYAEKAIYEYINEKYSEFELKQKRTDDLRQFVTFSVINVVNQDYITLPNDYLRLLKLEYKINYPPCYNDIWVVAQKTTADKLGYSENNYYWKPSINNPQYQLIGDNIYFRVGGNNSYITAIRLEYIAKPILYTIDPSNLNVYSNPPYSDEVDMQIIDKIVRMFQGATNPEQYQIAVGEKQFKMN
jgi:hypothetical protein